MNKQKRLRTEIGSVLKAWFDAHGLAIKDVANRLDVSSAYISGMCSGTKTIGKKTATKLSEAFGISESYLLTGKGLIEEQPRSEITHDELQKNVLYQNAIQKANRIYAALNYLEDRKIIRNKLDVAPVLGVLPSVINQATKFDKDGKYDYVILRLVDNYPQLNMEWLLTGEGKMLISPAVVSQEIMTLKKELADLRAEIKQTRNDIRETLNVLKTQSTQNVMYLAADDLNTADGDLEQNAHKTPIV